MDAIGQTQLLEILTTMAGHWSSPTIRLFDNNVVVAPGDSTQIYTEPQGASWYSPQSITYGTPYIDVNGNAAMTAPEVQFTYGSSSSSSVLIYGAFVSSPSGTLVSSYNFNPPLPMGNSGNVVLAGSQITLPVVSQSTWVE